MGVCCLKFGQQFGESVDHADAQAFEPLAVLMAVGIVVHRLTFRRLTRTSPNLDVFEARGLMVSFGLMFLVQNFAQVVWGGDLRGYDFMADPVAVGGAQFSANKLLLLFWHTDINTRRINVGC